MSTIATKTCSHSETRIQREGVPAPHYGRVLCTACGAQVGWEPAPMTPERAASFRLPMGKHRLKTLAAIDEGGDRAYLEWAVMTWTNPGVVRALRAYLETHPSR